MIGSCVIHALLSGDIIEDNEFRQEIGCFAFDYEIEIGFNFMRERRANGRRMLLKRFGTRGAERINAKTCRINKSYCH